MNAFLETERLILTRPSLTDIDNLCELQSDSEVMQYIGNGVRTREEVMSGLEKAITHQEKHGFSLGSVYEKESGEFIGRAGLIYLGYDDTQPDIEIGYAFVKTAWGKGYATELTNALIAWGFTHLAVERLIAVARPENSRSRHVLEKSGMTYVGLANYWDCEVALYELTRHSRAT